MQAGSLTQSTEAYHDWQSLPGLPLQLIGDHLALLHLHEIRAQSPTAILRLVCRYACGGLILSVRLQATVLRAGSSSTPDSVA